MHGSASIPLLQLESIEETNKKIKIRNLQELFKPKEKSTPT
jgi:hypothetical protein